MLMTFHKTLPGCEQGDRDAWRLFLARYTPIVFQLFGVYLPGTPEQRWEFWREAVRALCAGNYERLRAFSHQSEREFLVDVRAFLLDRVSAAIDSSLDAQAPPGPTVETLGALLKGLPLLHQEIVFLTLAGYSQATLEKVLRISPAVAQQGFERLRADYAPVLERSEDRCLWPAGWTAITRTARAGKRDDCAPLRLLVRILDGQATWYEKSPVEEHRATCLHCLEFWTSLLEVSSWERVMKPWPPEQIEPLLADLPLRAPEKSRGSLFARIRGK